MDRLGSIFNGGRRRRELYRDGMVAFNRGDFTSAIAAFSQIADEDNLHGRLARLYLARAHRQIGVEALERGELERAIEGLRQACRRDPAGGEPARLLAVALYRSGQHAAAIAPLERALAANPADARARVMLALALWRTGQIDRAELALVEAVRPGAPNADFPHPHAEPARPQDAPAAMHFHLGLLAAQSEHWDQAQAHLSCAVAADEECAQAWRYLGLACAACGRPDEAVAHLRRAQRLAPSDPHVALELSLAASATATPAPVRRLRLADLAASARPAEQLEDLDRLAQAVIAEPELIGAFLDLPPSGADPHIFGVLSISLRRALSARPDFADLHHYASRVNQRLGRIGEAIDSAEQALAINPRFVSALIHAASLYHQTSQRGAAAERLRAAIAAGGDYPDVHLRLGDLYRELGQVDRARRSYARALQLKPEYGPARQALDALAA